MQNIDINNIVRSVAIAAVGLPLAFSTSGLINALTAGATQVQQVSARQAYVEEKTEALIDACYDYALSKVDSKLEREAKTAIDEVFGGEVNYTQVCSAFVF